MPKYAYDKSIYIQQSHAAKRYCISANTLGRAARSGLLTQKTHVIRNGRIKLYLIEELEAIKGDWSRRGENLALWESRRAEARAKSAVEEAETLPEKRNGKAAVAVDPEGLLTTLEGEAETHFPWRKRATGETPPEPKPVPNPLYTMPPPRPEAEPTTTKPEALKALGLDADVFAKTTPTIPKGGARKERPLPPEHKIVPPPIPVQGWKVGDHFFTNATAALKAWRHMVGEALYNMMVDHIGDFRAALQAEEQEEAWRQRAIEEGNE